MLRGRNSARGLAVIPGLKEVSRRGPIHSMTMCSATYLVLVVFPIVDLSASVFSIVTGLWPFLAA